MKEKVKAMSKGQVILALTIAFETIITAIWTLNWELLFLDFKTVPNNQTLRVKCNAFSSNGDQLSLESYENRICSINVTSLSKLP